MTEAAGIVHVSEALGGGILRVVQMLANATAERGVDTVVVHGRRPETPADVAAAFHPRVRVVEVSGWGRRTGGEAAATPRAGATILRELRRHRGGVLHLHSTFAGAVGRCLPAHGHSVFYTPHAYVFLSPDVSPPVRRVARLVERVLAQRGTTIACSRSEGDIAEALAPEGRVVVIPNGVNLDALPAPEPEPEDGFVVGCVGRAVSQRRPGAVARLARRLSEELDMRFVWFGDGPFRDELVAAGVSVSGWLDAAAAVEAYGKTNVVLHLSGFEGLPIALLEAMAAARPVVASDLPAVRDVLGETGMLVADEHQTVEALRALRSQPPLRRRLGALARERVVDVFGHTGMIDRTLSLYSVDVPLLRP